MYARSFATSRIGAYVNGSATTEKMTEYSVIFSAVALPLTYVPILLVANDRAYMGRHANGKTANVFGIFYLVVVVAIALAAVPLMIASNMGQG